MHAMRMAESPKISFSHRANALCLLDAGWLASSPCVCVCVDAIEVAFTNVANVENHGCGDDRVAVASHALLAPKHIKNALRDTRNAADMNAHGIVNACVCVFVRMMSARAALCI